MFSKNDILIKVWDGENLGKKSVVFIAEASLYGKVRAGSLVFTCTPRVVENLCAKWEFTDRLVFPYE